MPWVEYWRETEEAANSINPIRWERSNLVDQRFRYGGDNYYGNALSNHRDWTGKLVWE